MKLKGLFAGLTTVDLFYQIEDFPERNTKQFSERFNATAGGPAANAAATFAHLGGTAELVSPIGGSAIASLAKTDLINCGVSINDPISHKKTEPVISTIISSKSNGDRTVIASPIPEFEIPSVSVKDSIRYAEIVLVDGFHPQLCLSAAKQARLENIPLVLDAGSEKECTEELIAYSTDVIASEHFHPEGIFNAEEIIEYLLQKGVKRAAVTRGGKPIVYSSGNGIHYFATQKVKVLDTLGAGDIFHGAYAYALLSTKGDFEQALQFAGEIASVSCSFFGTREWMRVSLNR